VSVRVFAIVALIVATGAVPRQTQDAMSVGSSVRADIAAFGPPNVVTTDVGHIWTWLRPGGGILRVTTDDNGIIRMVDVLAAAGARSNFAVPPPASLGLTFNETTLDIAESKLASFADFGASAMLPDSGDAAVVRGYKLSPANELVLLFNTAHMLREAFLGDRNTMERSGLVPRASGASYHAPVLQKLGAVDFRGQREGVTFVRIEVGADGSVRDATVFVSSGDSDLDRLAVTSAKLDTFAPATRNGKPTDGVYFYRENFIIERPPLH
jgi:TonB family protein